MKIQDYKEALPQIADLFQRSYGRSVDQGFLAWRYASSVVHHEEAFVELMENEGSLAAHYGCSIAKLRKGSDYFMAGITGAVMTDPLVQGKGLFRNSGNACHASLVAAGFDLEFAFPNRNSNPIFLLKMGWQPIYEIPTLTIQLGAEQSASPEQSENSNDFKFDSDFSRFDYSKEIMTLDEYLRVPRESNFYLWRFKNHPRNKYSNLVIEDDGALSAFAVLKFYTVNSERMIDIVDFQAVNRDAFIELTDRLKAYAISERCRAINVWAPIHHYSHHEFLRAGYFLTSPVTYFSYKSILVDEKVDAGKFISWWITMADSDVY